MAELRTHPANEIVVRTHKTPGGTVTVTWPVGFRHPDAETLAYFFSLCTQELNPPKTPKTEATDGKPRRRYPVS